MVALVEDPGPGREGTRDRHPRETLQLPLLEVGEERNAAQELGRTGCLLDISHAVDYRATGGRTDGPVGLS